jgi:bacillopeptidase F (M6 metalloprotease family)
VLASVASETDVYNDTIASGVFIDGGSEVSNPLSDTVNSSVTCAQSGTEWQKIEFFPTYTPVSGDKLYFSVYNPNNVTSAQIKFDYSDGSTEQWGGNVTYDASASSGWVEHSLDLTDHVGNEINKIWLFLAGGEANFAYVDNVYFHTSSVLSVDNLAVNNNKVFFDSEGKVSFKNMQTNTTVYVFDINGKLLFKEVVNGSKTLNSIKKKGLYFSKIKNENSVSNHKIILQ